VKDAICPSFDPGTVSLRAIRSLRRLLNFCMRFMMAQQIFAHRAGAAVAAEYIDVEPTGLAVPVTDRQRNRGYVTV
jgi:hypothetical protein